MRCTTRGLGRNFSECVTAIESRQLYRTNLNPLCNMMVIHGNSNCLSSSAAENVTHGIQDDYFCLCNSTGWRLRDAFSGCAVRLFQDANAQQLTSRGWLDIVLEKQDFCAWYAHIPKCSVLFGCCQLGCFRLPLRSFSAVTEQITFRRWQRIVVW